MFVMILEDYDGVVQTLCNSLAGMNYLFDRLVLNTQVCKR